MGSHFSFSKLVVDDLDRCAAFYQSVFELAEQARVDAAIEGRPIREIMFHPTAEAGATFVLLKFQGERAPAPGELILGFITPDLEALVAHTRAAGGTIAEDIKEMEEHGVR